MSRGMSSFMTIQSNTPWIPKKGKDDQNSIHPYVVCKYAQLRPNMSSYRYSTTKTLIHRVCTQYHTVK